MKLKPSVPKCLVIRPMLQEKMMANQHAQSLSDVNARTRTKKIRQLLLMRRRKRMRLLPLILQSRQIQLRQLLTLQKTHPRRKLMRPIKNKPRKSLRRRKNLTIGRTLLMMLLKL